jgi:hypothetical protein
MDESASWVCEDNIESRLETGSEVENVEPRAWMKENLRKSGNNTTTQRVAQENY